MIPRALVVILRLHLGVILLLTDVGKLTRDRPFSVEMLAFLQYAMRNASAPYRAFVEHAVVPHATTFSVLVMTGELVAGLSLLFGIATRAGAAIAMLLFVNYMLAKGRMFWSPDSEDAAVFFSALVVGLAAAGRSFGVDALLHRRWPRVPLW
jgi:uncharacterized membrane protein YphA (DoxX/SURF4 family)